MPGAGRPSRRAPGPRETECEPRGHRAVPPLTRAGTLHKAPTAPAPCGLSAGRQRGLRSHTPATQGERKINSSHLTGAEELGGSWYCLGFPSCKHRQRKHGNDALRGALPTNTATRKSARRLRGRGVSWLRAPPLCLLPIGSLSAYRRRGRRSPRAGAPDAGRFPWQRRPGATLSPVPTCSLWTRPGNFAQGFPGLFHRRRDNSTFTYIS